MHRSFLSGTYNNEGNRPVPLFWQSIDRVTVCCRAKVSARGGFLGSPSSAVGGRMRTTFHNPTILAIPLGRLSRPPSSASGRGDQTPDVGKRCAYTSARGAVSASGRNSQPLQERKWSMDQAVFENELRLSLPATLRLKRKRWIRIPARSL